MESVHDTIGLESSQKNYHFMLCPRGQAVKPFLARVARTLHSLSIVLELEVPIAPPIFLFGFPVPHKSLQQPNVTYYLVIFYIFGFKPPSSHYIIGNLVLWETLFLLLLPLTLRYTGSVKKIHRGLTKLSKHAGQMLSIVLQ